MGFGLGPNGMRVGWRVGSWVETLDPSASSAEVHLSLVPTNPSWCHGNSLLNQKRQKCRVLKRLKIKIKIKRGTSKFNSLLSPHIGPMPSNTFEICEVHHEQF